MKQPCKAFGISTNLVGESQSWLWNKLSGVPGTIQVNSCSPQRKTPGVNSITVEKVICLELGLKKVFNRAKILSPSFLIPKACAPMSPRSIAKYKSRLSPCTACHFPKNRIRAQSRNIAFCRRSHCFLKLTGEQMKTYDNHGSLNWRHATNISSTQPLSWLGVWLSFLLGAVLQILHLRFSKVKGTENHLQVLALGSSLVAVCGDSLGACSYNQLAGSTKILGWANINLSSRIV